ncbi:hypothetical protein [Gracilibacillus phocaeensis]|uniref:hypothetical protein n=1 Tax=Gracilibacillus phocaeensis TaxID=2042304 RepID=UPI00103276AD|nr:hypothetical protein [Gracilibacillus phocaeensis]
MRPVLIIVLSDDGNQALGLKITGSPRYNRIPIINSPYSGLTKRSYVQFDRYKKFENIHIKEIGVLSKQDFKNITRTFIKYHDL